MSRRINVPVVITGLIISCLFIFSGHGEANSFPFRSVNVGDPLPAVSVNSLADQQEESLAKYKGKPLVLVFFGADIPTKKDRSVKALKELEKMAGYLKDKGAAVLVVDAQGDDPGTIKEVISEAASTFPVYVDTSRQAYGNLGIFVMPSIMLVGADGNVVAGMGYSHDLAQRLKGEIEVMLGEKTRAQVEEELRPEMVEKSAEEKGAHRYYNLGMTMIEKGQPEAAMREMVKAIELAPNMGKAHVQLGCLQLDAGQTEAARASLAKGTELAPDMIEGKICAARLKVKDGYVDEAIDDINFEMLRNSRSPSLHYVLGTMLEAKDDKAAAMHEYRKAYELQVKSSHEK